MLAWPHPDSDWRELLPGIENDFLQLARAVLDYELLVLICRDREHRQHIESLLSRESIKHPVLYCETLYNDTWCRDYGPITVIKNARPVPLDFQFNGWGNRYDATLDNDINRQLDRQNVFSTRPSKVDLILEGGSIESDGNGTLLTTEGCLLNQNRNNLDRRELEILLGEHLSARRVLWLKHGRLEGDDTDGHIDNLARFVAEDAIAFLDCGNGKETHFPELREMRNELTAFRQNNGEPYRLIPLPLPEPCFSRIDGHRLPASYLNFLIINGAVLVPKFGCRFDTTAQRALQQCFPGRRIVTIDGRGFIEQNGGVHCLTMQLPAGTLNNVR